MKKQNTALYFLITFLLILQLRTCFVDYKEEVLRVDTVEVIKIIPSKKNTFKIDSLKPVTITKYIDTSKQRYDKLFQELENKYNKKADSVTILRELLQSKIQRKYIEEFTDSTLHAEVTAYTTGTLDSLQFSYETKQQEIRYDEITKYISPKIRVLTGLEARLNTSLDKFNVSGNIGIQTKKGNIYSIGYDTEKNIKAGVYIPLFTKY